MKLLRGISADDLVADLAESELADTDARTTLHFYSFGGIARTVEWATAAKLDFEQNA